MRDVVEEDYSWLTPAQYYGSVAVGVTASALSLVGSGIIVYLVSKRPNVWREPDQIYHRIILGLSIMDIIISIGTFLSPFFMRNDIGLPLAFGTVGTCTFTGFFITYFVGSCLYNCLLGLYYVRTIRGGVPSYRLSRRYEPWIHIVAFVVPTAFSFAGVATEAFNPNVVLGVCLTVPYPWNCPWLDDIECQRGAKGGPVGAYHLWVTMAGTIVGIISTIVVYCTVRRTTSQWAARSDQQVQRRRQVAVQSVCYMAAFLNGLVWAVLNSVIFGIHVVGQETISDLVGNTTLFASTMLMTFFFPLQGLFNFFVYIRPRLLRWKDSKHDVSWWWAFQQVLTGKPAPTRTASEGTNNTKASNDSHRARWMTSAAAIRQPPTITTATAITTNTTSNTLHGSSALHGGSSALHASRALHQGGSGALPFSGTSSNQQHHVDNGEPTTLPPDRRRSQKLMKQLSRHNSIEQFVGDESMETMMMRPAPVAQQQRSEKIERSRRRMSIEEPVVEVPSGEEEKSSEDLGGDIEQQQ